MKAQKGPFTQPGWRRRVAANVIPPLMDCFSGELKVSRKTAPLGAAPCGGKIRNVWLSVQSGGKDDANDALSIEADVFINGVSALSTKPKISYVSGEAATNKTTVVTGDTGITQATMGTAVSFAPGDFISYDLILARTATPTSEVINPCIVVELEPNK